MERRLLLAIVLALLVWFVPLVIWPPKPNPAGQRASGRADTAALQTPAESVSSADRPLARPSASRSDTGRTVWVQSPLYRLGFSTDGGRLTSVELLKYQAFAPGDSAQPVELVPHGDAFLGHRLVLPGGDTVSLDDWVLKPTPDVPGIVVNAGQPAQTLRLDGDRGASHVTLE